jgi:hypothetical protein
MIRKARLERRSDTSLVCILGRGFWDSIFLVFYSDTVMAVVLCGRVCRVGIATVSG